MVDHGEFRPQPLDKNDPCERFVCADYPALEDFIRTKALRNQTEGYGKTFVLRGTLDGQPAVFGYYTVVMTSTRRELVPKKKRHGTPKDIPVALIGRLAVDDRVRGQGHGATLLRDALERVHAVAQEIGCYAVIVDAKDQKAENFYRHYGFEPTPFSDSDVSTRMYLKMETIARLVTGGDE